MQDNSQNSFTLDEVSRLILLLLSYGDALTLHNIAKALQRVENAILFGLITLEKHSLISKNKNSNSYQITEKGRQHANVIFGIRSIKPGSENLEGKTHIKRRIDWDKPLKGFFIWASTLIWLTMTGTLIAISLLLLFSRNFLYGSLSLLILIVFLIGTIRIVKQSTTLVIFRFGICIGAKGPGPVLTFPIIDKLEPVELKVDHKAISEEACITKDNVQIKVDFVYYWQIRDAEKSVTEVTNASDAIKLLATGALRAVIASFAFSDLQEQRQDLNKKLQNEIDVYSSKWGIYVTNVEIQEVKTSDEIRKAMEDWRAAKWRSESAEIIARGQAEALKELYTVANIIDSNTLNLKYFETLAELGKGEATKYILPMELTNLVQSWIRESQSKTDQGEGKKDNPPVPESSKGLVKPNGAKSPTP